MVVLSACVSYSESAIHHSVLYIAFPVSVRLVKYTVRVYLGIMNIQNYVTEGMTASDSSDTPNIDYEYRESERSIYVIADDTAVEIYQDASRDEYDFFVKVEELENNVATLVLSMVSVVQQSETKAIEFIDQFISKMVGCYNQCLLYQQIASSFDSKIITGQISRLYKIEKASKHGIRVLSVVQNWFGTQHLLGAESAYKHYIYRYGYILGVHSNASFLAKMLVNKVSDDSIDPHESSINLPDAYEKIEEQGLNSISNEEYTVEIQPTGQKWKMSAIPLSKSEIDRLHTRRNHIAHHSPLYVPNTDVSTLPEELVSSQIITHKQLAELTELASRLHHHMFNWLTEYSKSYLNPMISEMVGAWYLERSD